MSNLMYNIVEATLIERIREEIDMLTYIKYNLNIEKAVDEKLEKCKRELKMMMEAGDE